MKNENILKKTEKRQRKIYSRLDLRPKHAFISI